MRWNESADDLRGGRTGFAGIGSTCPEPFPAEVDPMMWHHPSLVQNIEFGACYVAAEALIVMPLALLARRLILR